MSTENRSQAKRAVLISCSDHYGHRLWAVDTYLKSRGYETVYLTSDFSHDRKAAFTCSVPGCRQLHVRPYQKNLSADRILSHREFAKKAVRWLEELEQSSPSCRRTSWRSIWRPTSGGIRMCALCLISLISGRRRSPPVK